jgi:O-antigen ligase
MAWANRLGVIALMLLPGALIVFLGFNAGGYFPTTPAIAAIVLTQVLVVRILQSARPFEGLAPLTLVAIVALGGYAAITLASALWSHSTGRALIELNRAWLYLLALLLFGTLRAGTENLRWLVRGLAGGAAIVCIAGLISRVAPDVWHTAPNVANERLSYPVTYWNALGLLAALGILFAAHLTCSLREPRFVRVSAAAVLPLFAATLFFTFSRGAIAATVIGLVLYALLARPRALLGGALAVIAPTAVLIVVAYHANLLDTLDPTTPAAVGQGHRVALVAAACAIACAALRLLFNAVLDQRVARLVRGIQVPHAARIAATVGVIAIVAVAVPVLGIPQTLSHDWNRFVGGATPHGEKGDLRQRLTDPSSNQRTLLWKVALQGFDDSPAHGHGAGTFQTIWDRRRPRYNYVVNAHSLYLQAMAELGIPGVALLTLLVAAVLVGLALRARGARRSLYGVLLAASLAWALHAGVDWDWEMPVITLPFFAIAGLALGPRGARGASWVPGHTARLLLGMLSLVTLVIPVLIIGSQRHLDEAEHALYAAHCTSASSAALSSIGWLDVRAQPYEVLGFCDLERGLPHLGIEAMDQAVHRDPLSWEGYYALAIARAAAGLDPRPNARRALRMNPLDPLVRRAARQLATSSALEWVRRSAIVRGEALASNDLSIAPS